MADETDSDIYRQLGFVGNSDGSFTRMNLPPEFAITTPISSYAEGSVPVLAKDIIINQSKNIWIRVFLPRSIVESSLETTTKLPLIVFFHGGGFLFQSAATAGYYLFYETTTVVIPAMLVSVDYRLAPEHRLPAAYDDAMEALHWIKNSQDELFSKYADVSNTYFMGGSAGANIAYQLGLRAAPIAKNLKPLIIKGLILHQPFFGGIERTRSQLRSPNDKYLPLSSTDAIWSLALPVGADRDHEYCNPKMGFKSDVFDLIKTLGWKILITGQEGDPLIDHQVEFFMMLKEKGLEAVGKFKEGGYHGDECSEPSQCMNLCNLAKEFVAPSIAA